VADSVTSPLLKEHAKIRETMGELRAYLARFDVPGIRQAVRDLKDTIGPHALKEESVLYLIGMKFLRADNTKLPELFKEHHETAARLNVLSGLLYSNRFMEVQDQIQQLTFVLMESIEDHLSDEESIVWPALEKLIDPQTKDLILSRYTSAEADNFDEFDRVPLVSMPDMADNEGIATPLGNKPMNPSGGV
jgi:iron-sulfur cluster repair protein YtfE (RIC family)